MSPLVSIIIPIYKVEEYIDVCFQSLINQTYSNWEAICVDDGSPDRCPQIIEEYAVKDPRFKPVHKENGGLSDARNFGMVKAQGEYLFFLDSDDFLHPQTIEICVSQAQRDNSDLVAFTYNHPHRTVLRFLHFLHLPDIKITSFPKYKIADIKTVTTDNIFNYVTEHPHEDLPGVDNFFRVKHCMVWRCMYRTDRIRDVKFVKGIQYEDLPWWGETLLHIRRATINNLPLYYYYPSKISFMLKSSQQIKINHLHNAISIAEKVYENAGTDFQKQVWNNRFIAPFKSYLARKIKRYSK